jgi:hypothetical protein
VAQIFAKTLKNTPNSHAAATDYNRFAASEVIIEAYD